MTFRSIYEVCKKNLQDHIRQNTWVSKNSIIEKKILPYFGGKWMCDVKPIDVLHWQNEMMAVCDENTMPYSLVCLKIIHNQLSAIFNHAVRFNGLHDNPAAITGNKGKEKVVEVLIWTQEEYRKFVVALTDRPVSYMAFETLYRCGLRLGGLLALPPADFDFENKIIYVTKSYQCIKREDIITPPKTDKSICRVLMPDFFAEEIRQHILSLNNITETDRIFQFTKSYLHHEICRGCVASGVKRIRIHGIRHSHIGLLIDMGFSAVAIADRVGQESIDITYRYAHVFPSAQLEVVPKLNNIMATPCGCVEK